jgi:hypothetical protein
MTLTNSMNLMDDDEATEAVILLVDEDIKQSQIQEAVGDTKEFVIIRQLLVAHMQQLNAMFRFYCGFSHSGSKASAIGGNTATLSMHEYNHFISSTNLFNLVTEGERLEYIFSQVNREKTDHPAGDVELLRHEFLECIVRLALVKWGEEKTASEKVRIVLEEYIKPRWQQLQDDEVRQNLAKPTVQALLQRQLPSLLVVYKHYASQDMGTGSGRSRSTARPTMNIGEFCELMTDSALLDATQRDSRSSKAVEAEEQEEEGGEIWLCAQEARMAFAKSQSDQDSTKEDLSEMIFAEFVEALARVAVDKWEVPSMTFESKLTMAIESVVGLKKLVQLKNMDREQNAKKTGR